LQAQLEEHLAKRLIPNGLHGVYKKWLRYYLDFCQKYRFPPKHKESLPRFIQKLQEKKQTNAQQEQARNAIKLYYDTLLGKNPSKPEPLVQPPGL
jgi:recombinational DNA repair protein (RecF pathway)